MAAKNLTDTSLKALKPRERFYKVTVGGCPGLVLMVFPNGSKTFRLQFTFEGKSQLLTLGQYPGTSLSDARAAALLHKESIRKGINPCAEKRESKAKAKALWSPKLPRAARSTRRKTAILARLSRRVAFPMQLKRRSAL